MIMPSKYVKEHESLLALGAVVLKEIKDDGTNLSLIWDKLKNNEDIFNFNRFILTLDMLFILGLIEIRNNKIIKVLQ